jgi:MFS family permease
MRAVMGLGGAAIMPATLSILTTTFRDPRERAQAIAIWSATFALGTGIGPLVGGYLLEHYHWSSVFFVNIPIVIIGLIGGYFVIQNSRGAHPRRIDLLGFALSIAGLFALVYAIIRAGVDGWSAPPVLWSFLAAAVLLGLFALGERRSKSPILPLQFFRNPSFTGANLARRCVPSAVRLVFFLASTSIGQGYTPLEAGCGCCLWLFHLYRRHLSASLPSISAPRPPWAPQLLSGLVFSIFPASWRGTRLILSSWSVCSSWLWASA